MSARGNTDHEEHEITNPVEECRKWQRRYYRCVKKFGQGYVKGDARTEKRDQCLERFDDFQKCVLDTARLMQEQRDRNAGKSWW